MPDTFDPHDWNRDLPEELNFESGTLLRSRSRCRSYLCSLPVISFIHGSRQHMLRTIFCPTDALAALILHILPVLVWRNITFCRLVRDAKRPKNKLEIIFSKERERERRRRECERFLEKAV